MAFTDEKLKELKELDLTGFIAAVKDLELADFSAACGTRKTSELFIMSEDTVNLSVTHRFNIAKMIQSRMKKEMIEPFAELKKKEEAEETQKAAAKAEERKKYAVEIDAIFTEALRSQIEAVGRRFIESGLGTLVDIGLVVKKDPTPEANGAIKLFYSSTVSKERTTGGPGRPKGSGAGRASVTRSVTVNGGDTAKGAPVVLTEAKAYKSFADAVRDLKPADMPVTDADWTGFNAKRYLQSKGYVCEFVTAPAPEVKTEEKTDAKTEAPVTA